jgi:hypothetical protein
MKIFNTHHLCNIDREWLSLFILSFLSAAMSMNLDLVFARQQVVRVSFSELITHDKIAAFEFIEVYDKDGRRIECFYQKVGSDTVFKISYMFEMSVFFTCFGEFEEPKAATGVAVDNIWTLIKERFDLTMSFCKLSARRKQQQAEEEKVKEKVRLLTEQDAVDHCKRFILDRDLQDLPSVSIQDFVGMFFRKQIICKALDEINGTNHSVGQIGGWIECPR